MKPLLDTIGILDISAINCLSGSTVLAMSCYSVIKEKMDKSSKNNAKIGIPLAAGAIQGGIIGKRMFEAVGNLLHVIITIGTLIYTI